MALFKRKQKADPTVDMADQIQVVPYPAPRWQPQEMPSIDTLDEISSLLRGDPWSQDPDNNTKKGI